MKRIVFTMLLFSFVFIFIFSKEKQVKVEGFNNDLYKKICGVWYRENNKTKYKHFDSIFSTDNKSYKIRKFSWGFSYYWDYDCIYIDYNNGYLIIYEDSVEGFYIKEIKKINKNTYKLIVKDEQPHPDEFITMELTILNDRNIQIIESEYYFKGTYYKIGGPDIPFDEFYIPTINNLRLREANYEKLFNENKVIRLLKKEEKLVVLKKIKKELINGIEGYWVEIETEDGEIGICFSGYLKQMKSNDKVKKK